MENVGRQAGMLQKKKKLSIRKFFIPFIVRLIPHTFFSWLRFKNVEMKNKKRKKNFD